MPGVATTLVASMNPAFQGAARQAISAHQQGDNGLQAFASSLPGMIIPTLMAVGLGYVTSHIVDSYLAPPVDMDLERRKMYEEMRGMVKTGDAPTGNAYRKPDPEVKTRVINPAERDMNDMTTLVKSSITKLKEAREDLAKAEGKSRCSLCKTTLSELGETLQRDEETVKKETDFILKTSDKWRTMQDLKATGKLRADASWDTMTPSERKLVGGI